MKSPTIKKYIERDKCSECGKKLDWKPDGMEGKWGNQYVKRHTYRLMSKCCIGYFYIWRDKDLTIGGKDE